MNSNRNKRQIFERDNGEDAKKKRCDVIVDKSSLGKIQITRSLLEEWCESLYLDGTVEGCFVKVNIGPGVKGAAYRIAEIVKVVNTKQHHQLEHKTTTKTLKLKYEGKLKEFPMKFVSNQPFNQEEFDLWKQYYNSTSSHITMGHVRAKQRAIEIAHMNNKKPRPDSRTMLQKKYPVAPRKSDLRFKLRHAIEANDEDLVKRIRLEMSFLEKMDEKGFSSDSKSVNSKERLKNEKTKNESTANTENEPTTEMKETPGKNSNPFKNKLF